MAETVGDDAIQSFRHSISRNSLEGQISLLTSFDF